MVGGIHLPLRRTGLRLAGRDAELCVTLASRIRIANICQIARTWWTDSPSGREYARERLRLLARAGLLVGFNVRAHPELADAAPIWCWHPGDPTPPFGVVSYRLRTRWTEPHRPITVFAASQAAARLYGGKGGRLSHPLQVTHDLHVAAIYLRLLRESPSEANCWVSEDVLAPARRRQKLPDAEIHDASGRTLKVIEFGGSYPPERVRKVHEDCENRQVPYELW